MRTIINCRSCGSANLQEILDLGFQYLSDFREDDSKPSSIPLVALLCMGCMLVQLRDTAPSGDMYHENYGFKSGVSNSIKQDLNDVVLLGQLMNPDAYVWLDIASNDGTLLSFVPDTIMRVGVDPIGFLCEEAKQHADFVFNDFFSADVMKDMPLADVVTSISCFYDMDDPNQFVSDVAKVMKQSSIWIIQQNYLLTTMQLDAVDNFCHEHLEYYTLLSLEPLLERHGLEVIKVETSMINGGSIRTVVANKGARVPDESVEKQRQIELEYGLDKLASYQRFARDVTKNLTALKELVDEINDNGETVFILAASTRGSTIWQAAGIDSSNVGYAVERNPAKVGRYFSAIGIPIISEVEAHKLKPDYMIIGPWFFADEIIDRERGYLEAGGKLIKPLPQLEVISG